VLTGKTLGVLGLGNLGRTVIPVARALGMRVVAWSRNLTDERAAAEGVERVDHDVFFRDSDVITVIIPEFVVRHWWEHLLHNQSALFLKGRLLFRKGTVVTSVPYHVE